MITPIGAGKVKAKPWFFAGMPMYSTNSWTIHWWKELGAVVMYSAPSIIS
jgi:hypothetical protein